MALENELTADEQAVMDQMREADNTPLNDNTPVSGASDNAGDTSDAGADPAAATDPAAADKRQQMVPHAALHEERERRKEYERQLNEERKARQTLEERTNLVLQQFLQQQKPATNDNAAPVQPALPTLEQDPVGHIVGLVQRQGGDLEAVRRELAQRQQLDQQAQAIGQLQQQAVAAEREFRATTPDYDAAVSFLQAGRNRELEIAGFAPEQRQAIIMQEALGIVARARQFGRNPAAVIYDLAKARGYTGAPPANTNTPPAGSENVSTPAERIQQAAAGQQQARSLSQTRGSGPAPLNAAALVNMSPKDFAAFLEKKTPEQLAEHLGA
jgi:hypothetical protein